jgi:hypothetical protein
MGPYNLRPRFEPTTYGIRRKNVKYSTTTIRRDGKCLPVFPEYYNFPDISVCTNISIYHECALQAFTKTGLKKVFETPGVFRVLYIIGHMG